MQKKLKHYVLAAMLLLAPVAASAQVTIGNGEKPADFSVLELVSNDTRGLRLPQIATTNQRDEIFTTEEEKSNPLAQGLQIFNMETRCVETWNGTKWISQCAMCGDKPCVYLDVKCNNIDNIPIPQFMAYNLGANPDYKTPKEQMKYLSLKRQEANYDQCDATVFGGLYQWGRAGHSYAVSTDGTFRRYHGMNLAAGAADVTAAATYDENGQILTYDDVNSAEGLFIMSTNGNWNTSGNNTLWGNGKAIGTATNDIPGGIPCYATGALSIVCDGKTYQSPLKTVNDPCPAGWRIPTEDEWERIGKYDCKSYSASASNNFNSLVTGGEPNADSPFTWVPVVCSGSGCTADDASWTIGDTRPAGTYSGHAVYKKGDWASFPDKTGDLSADNAPEPFLFLPAAGCRDFGRGTIDLAGSRGFYWSSTVTTGNNASTLDFYRNSVRHISNERGWGYSVRCVAE